MSIIRKSGIIGTQFPSFFQAKLRKILKIQKFTEKMVKRNFETKANQKFTRSFRIILVPNLKRKRKKGPRSFQGKIAGKFDNILVTKGNIQKLR